MSTDRISIAVLEEFIKKEMEKRNPKLDNQGKDLGAVKKHFENLNGRFEIHDHEYIGLINKLRKLYPNSDIHIFSQPNIYKKYK